MTRVARVTAITVIVVVVALVVGTAATVATIAAGSSGTVVAPAGYMADGLAVERLDGASTPLENGDIVVAIDGTSMVEWAANLFELGLDRPDFPAGTTVPMAIRDDGARTVDVTTIAYPTGPVVLRNLGTVTFVVVFLAVAGYAFRRRPRDEAAAALLIAATGAVASTIPWLLGIDPLAYATGVFWLDQGAVGLVYLLLWAGGLHFALAFPRRSPLLGHRPAAAVLPYLLVFGLYVIGIAAMAPVSADPLAWLASWNVVQSVVVLGSLVAILVGIADGWRRSDADERRAFRWIALSLAFAIVASIVLFFVPELLTGRSLVSWSLVGFIDIPVPLALGAAILRSQAFGIEVVVRRIVVYGGLTAGVLLVYALIVAGLSTVLSGSADFPARLLAAGGAALVALPLRDVLQRAVGRYIYGDRDEPYRAISRLNERLALVMEPASTLQTVADTIADALRLPFVAVEIGEPGRLVASHGSVGSGVIRIPLVHGGEAVGHLLAAPRAGEDALSARDRSLLEDLAGQAAATVHAVHLTLDLQTSRERLVTAREEERRRLRRDLHDGLGPALAGMAMRAEAAAALTRSDPDETGRLLEALSSEAREALADIRRLVYGLRPPALDELGLSGAIRQVVEGVQPAVLTVEVDVPERLPELPAAAEVAAYRIVVEAVTNVVRHASAGWCAIRIRTDDGLSIVVDDDGVGLDGGTRPGVGLTSMHERAEELGGSCVVATRPEGGTRVNAWLPLDARFTSGPRGRACRRMTDTPEIRIVLADDHAAFRDGLRALLTTIEDMTVIGQAATGEEAVARARALQPDVVLMDLNMPGLDGIEATRRIIATSPHIAILVLTMYEDDESVFAALRAGAHGYLLKGADRVEIARAIRSVASGEAIFGSNIARRLVTYFSAPRPGAAGLAFPELTERELEILELIARGLSNTAISERLVLSPKTVRNHVSNIFSKLQVAGRAEAIVRAREAGMGGEGQRRLRP